ncbi:precorrin-2 dehydrogenase/sirohydrochlorin ferrochelatase family protein [Miniphocaeibacter sp.]
MLELKNKNITLVGGGYIAARKIKALMGQGALVKVISPSLHKDIDRKAIIWNKKKYEKDDIRDADLIFACTSSSVVNEQVKKDALPHQWVNVVSNKNLSDFFNMATLNWKNFKINISSEGVSPSKTKELKEKMIKLLDNIDDL